MPTDFVRVHSDSARFTSIGVTANYDRSIDAFKVCVAPGTYALRCVIAGYDFPLERVVVLPGNNAVELIGTRASRGIVVSLIAKSHDSEFPLPHDRWTSVRVLDASGKDRGFKSIGFKGGGQGECCESARAEIVLRGAGTYELSLPDVVSQPTVQAAYITVGADDPLPRVAVFAVQE